MNIYLDYKKKNKNDMKVENIIKKISNKIDLIISFGQTPYQLFIDKHPKFGKKSKNNEGDLEFNLIESNIEIDLPIFFIINDELGKLFLINKKSKNNKRNRE